MDYLIPEAPFNNLPLLVLIALAAGALWVLSRGADWLVDGASELALRLGLSKVVVGATVVSLGTTTPECAVSVMAAWSGNPGLALGNAVGSVIFDTAVIFGGGALLTTLPADRFLLSRQGWVQFGSAVILSAFCYVLFAVYGSDAAIPRWGGAVLLALLAVYLWISIRWSREHSQLALEQLEAHHHEEPPQGGAHDGHHRPVGRIVLEMFGGLLLVLVGSRLTIVAVTIIARRMQVPDVVISATLVAAGTSLPELIVGLTAIRRGHPELLVGNVIGADILNILFVTGAAAAAAPLPVVDTKATDPYVFLWLHLPTMLVLLTYFRICIARSAKQGRFDNWVGWPMLLGYAAFMALSFVSGSVPE